jgi:hypothetical protein
METWGHWCDCMSCLERSVLRRSASNCGCGRMRAGAPCKVMMCCGCKSRPRSRRFTAVAAGAASTSDRLPKSSWKKARYCRAASRWAATRIKSQQTPKDCCGPTRSIRGEGRCIQGQRAIAGPSAVSRGKSRCTPERVCGHTTSSRTTLTAGWWFAIAPDSPRNSQR